MLGHVVATDLTGDAYVLPMENILDDIKGQLDAQCVDLASNVDFSITELEKEFKRRGHTAIDRPLRPMLEGSPTVESPPEESKMLHPAPPATPNRNDASRPWSDSPETTAGEPGLVRRKLKRDFGDGTDEDNDISSPPLQKVSVPRGTEDTGAKTRRFACPYAQRYPSPRYESCFVPGFARLKDVKQHLRRKHLAPDFCIRCKMVFNSVEELSSHGRCSNGCELSLAPDPEGLTHHRQRILETRPPRFLTMEEQWFYLYEELFPDTPKPTSAFVRDDQSAQIQSFTEYMIRDGTYRIIKRLEEKGIPSAGEDSDISKLLASSIQEGLQEISSLWSSGQDLTIPELSADAGNPPLRKTNLEEPHSLPTAFNTIPSPLEWPTSPTDQDYWPLFFDEHTSQITDEGTTNQEALVIYPTDLEPEHVSEDRDMSEADFFTLIGMPELRSI